MADSPADHLDGIDLGNGWKVLNKITRKKISTGGHFSVGYKVQNAQGKEAFLKALDFTAALKSSDVLRTLQGMLEAYNYERDLLDKCRNRRLHRVMIPLKDGSINIPGYGLASTVHFLIFDLASGDIRDVMDDFVAFDLLWCLRSLHHVAVGLLQLHGNGIAHQDIKPSNVLFMGNDGSKIADLGCASDQSKVAPRDSYSVPGDTGYAPLDLYYQDTGADGFTRRLLTDLYLLGSLFFFHFTKVSAIHALRSKLHGVTIGNRSFKQDLPYFQHAFEESLNDLRPVVKSVAGSITPDIMEMVKQLCEPDPTRRGDPQWKGTAVPSYDLQRYVSKLDMLCRKVEIGLMK